MRVYTKYLNSEFSDMANSSFEYHYNNSRRKNSLECPAMSVFKHTVLEQFVFGGDCVGLKDMVMSI